MFPFNEQILLIPSAEKKQGWKRLSKLLFETFAIRSSSTFYNI